MMRRRLRLRLCKGFWRLALTTDHRPRPQTACTEIARPPGESACDARSKDAGLELALEVNLMQCKDHSEANELHKGYRLYLLPIARMNITVQLPSVHHSGKSISNVEVMERLHTAVRPDTFLQLKIVKSSLEFIRFEGELETRALIPKVKARLDNKMLKLAGFSEVLRVRACQAKPTEPSRHDWDAFFRDAEDMDEMKPGERPDTIHLQRLPTRWFSDQNTASSNGWPLPSELVLRNVFSVFGDIRTVHIPAIDRFQLTERTTISGDGTFEAYVQYKEYVCFVRAMDAFRGVKLMRLDTDGNAYATNVLVDFDRTKHLSEKSIRRRLLLQQKMEEEQNAKESARRAEEERRRRQADSDERQRLRRKKEEEKEERRRVREEKRRKKNEERRRQEEEQRMKEKIALEERKILIAVRRLEAIRLLSELLRRVKVRHENRSDSKSRTKRHNAEKRSRRSRSDSDRQRLQEEAFELRSKILKTMDNKERTSHKRRREKIEESPAPSKRSRSQHQVETV